MKNKYIYHVEQKKTVAFLAVLCFLSYAAAYIGRLNYSAALPGMISSGLVTKAEGGTIAMIYFSAYGFGQLFNGLIADRSNPRIQAGISLAANAILNLMMFYVDSPHWMRLIWGLNGYAQSLLWTPVFLIVSQSISWEYRPKAMLLLNMAPSMGTLSAYGFYSLVLRRASWRQLYFSAAVVLVIFLIGWIVGCRIITRSVHVHGACTDTQTMDVPQRQTNRRESIGIRCILLSGVTWFILPTMITGMLKDGVTSWFPTYMSEVFSMPAETAVNYSMLLPLINIFGAGIGYWLVHRLRSEALCMGILFSAAAVCTLLMTLTHGISPILSAMLFSVVTALMIAASVLQVSEVASRFGAFGIAGTLSGLFDAFSYAGTAISMQGIAWTAESFGWEGTCGMWFVSTLAALVCITVSIPAWKRFTARKLP